MDVGEGPSGPSEGLLKSTLSTVDVVYTWNYGGPHILTLICANDMKLCVYNAYVL